MAALTYDPAIFDAPDEAAAKAIILTEQAGQTPDERWARETPYLVDLIAEHMPPNPSDLILDFGCGIGRVAKGLIERFGCRVLGVDISPAMRTLAVDYVRSDRFSIVSPDMLAGLAASGLRADGAVAVWVLQHCMSPGTDIDLLKASMKPSATLFVINNLYRAVPTREKRWANDGVDVRALLGERFSVLAGGTPSAEVLGYVSDTFFWGVYR